MKWYTDGAGWNGKFSRWAVANDLGLERIIVKYERFTNNQAEYLAMRDGLTLAKDGDEICSDSELIVNQLLGSYRVKKVKLKPLHEECRNIISKKAVKLSVIRREVNKAGRLLERTKMPGASQD